MNSFYAHSLDGVGGGSNSRKDWEPLFTTFQRTNQHYCQGENCPDCIKMLQHHGHLNKVAWWSSHFAGGIAVSVEECRILGQWGYLAGLWHDLGKFSTEFQEYLLQAQGDSHQSEIQGRVDHSTAGAQHSVKALKVLGHFVAYGIAGHHSGLLNAEDGGASQRKRLNKKTPDIPKWDSAPEEVLQQPIPDLPDFIKKVLANPKLASFSSSFFTRMLFSCLVDADFLATEAFMNPGHASKRNQVPDKIFHEIAQQVDHKIESFGAPNPEDTVNVKRAEVVRDCRNAADWHPGFFSLTVPTGGGKTLSSALFAARHAAQHGKRRIIYVAPFTSIIEQNAEILREILQPLESSEFLPLIEHHSALSPDKESLRSRLAAENWDAPVVVTTAVQFYESLFACKTSKARKLHRIANSVIILDEAQTMQVSFLSPCLKALQELVQSYGVSVVLCTATQPAIQMDPEDFPIGLSGCREIIQNTTSLFLSLKRVEVKRRGQMTNEDLAEEISGHSQVLCIVNRRLHAQELFQLLDSQDGNFHLSALMCPEHRSQVLLEIRKRLNVGDPTRVISTQLVEAGVDVDFPLVYRALAGLDSIAQAAGRCNRHGKMKQPGKVYIFKPENDEAEQFVRDTAQVASQVLELIEDPLSEEAIRKYFDLYYFRNQGRWDEQHILECFSLRHKEPDFPMVFDFKDASERFKLINEWQVPVIIPFDDKAKGWINQLRNPTIPLNRNLFRGLQRYIVNINPKLFNQNRSAFNSLRDDQFHELISPELNYSDSFGLILDEEHANQQNLIL